MPQTIRQLLGECVARETGPRRGAQRPTPNSERPTPNGPAPLRVWAMLVAVAVGGSCLYGASLSLVLPAWSTAGGAAWLALSAGLAWCVFIPSLYALTRVPFACCWQTCLIAMGGGEVVLASGALVNALLWWHRAFAQAAAINAATVLVSNIAMAALLARQLHRQGVPVGRTLAAWMGILNGSGALFFAALYPLLHR